MTPKFYIEVPVEKELPEKNKVVTAYSIEYTHRQTYPISIYHDGEGWQEDGDILEHHGYIDSKIDYWLKELSLEELIIEFVKILTTDCNCVEGYCNGIDKKDLSKAIAEFLASKNILTK